MPAQVVLVRPDSPANIGAVARVVRNMGLAGLRLVRPGDWRTIEAWRTAWGSQEVLEEARVFPDLPSALAGATRAFAFSGRHDEGVPRLDVRAAAAAVADAAEDETTRLVFGPEDSGLTQREMAECGHRVLIPADPGQPSLNLSHAVMVAAYEVFRAGRGLAPPPQRAAHEDREAALGRLRDGLLAIGALPGTNTDRYFKDWLALFARADLTPKEVQLLEHLARKMARAAPRGPRR